MASADPHNCVGILAVTWCPPSAPLTLTLSVFVSSRLLGGGAGWQTSLGRGGGAGWRRMLSGEAGGWWEEGT